MRTARLAALCGVFAVAFVAVDRGRFGRFNSRCDQGRSGRGFLCDASAASALFEFAPASGAGMGTACACTAITDSLGGAVTVVRSTADICSKRGLATTGITPGDYVSCGANLPRVEPLSTGVLGVRVESVHANQCVRSQEINHASWASFNASSSDPVLNAANSVVAPDGTTTGEDYSFPATSGSARSLRFMSSALPAGNMIWSMHAIIVLSDGGVGLQEDGGYATGTLDLCCNPSSGATCLAGGCAVTSASWTRCSYPVAISSNGTCWVGHDSLYNGGVARSATRYGLWGAMANNVTQEPLMSYIPTTSASVTSQPDTINVLLDAGYQYGVLAATVQFEGGWQPTAVTGIASLGNHTDGLALLRLNSGDAGYTIGTTSTVYDTGGAISDNVARSYLSTTSGGVRTAKWNAATATAPAASMAGVQQTLRIGRALDGGSWARGIISQVQFCTEASPGGCTP